jgi:hypothetical protein
LNYLLADDHSWLSALTPLRERAMDKTFMTNSIGGIKGPEPVAGMRQARVDFVIAGAPKCGTTALYSYLATHPHISMSSRKEPYFWCSDILIPSPVTDPTAYASLWTDAPGAPLRGEATPAYLRSAVAGPAILRANPDAKFILLLRNPADMAVSFHAQMLVALQEDVADFESAWSLQAPRQRGERLPPACFSPQNLQYAWVCALGDQLERLMAIVPRAQVHVATLDELGAEPRATYLRVLDFLELADDGRTDFGPVNSRRRRRVLPLVRLYRRLTSMGAIATVVRRSGLTEASGPNVKATAARGGGMWCGVK